MRLYLSQDTFSFALVLLCLARGDIAFVRKQGGILARTAYYSGWRPTVPKSLRAACPEIAALIKEMWLADFRARPAMKDVVVRLEACVSVGDAVSYVEVGSALSSAEDKDENASQTKTEDTLRAEIKALKAQVEKADARHRVDRLEIAELKAALLAGTSLECDDDDVGILGGMFICTSSVSLNLLPLQLLFSPSNSPNHQPRNAPHTQSTPTRSAASSARGPLAPSIQ